MAVDTGREAKANATADTAGFEGWAARWAFAFYKRVLSPVAHVVSPTQCLYLPTCSEYAYVALVRFGAVRGSWLAVRRLARCHPFAKGGFDPVPDLPGSHAAGIHTDHLA